MKIGVPIEIKNNENRVGMTPSGVFELDKKKSYRLRAKKCWIWKWFF